MITPRERPLRSADRGPTAQVAAAGTCGPARLRTVVEQRAGAVVVRFSGDVDLATTGWFSTALDVACGVARTRLSIDLSGLAFIDCGGLDALSTAVSGGSDSVPPIRIVCGTAVTELLDAVSGWADLPGAELVDTAEPVVVDGFGTRFGVGFSSPTPDAVVVHLRGDLDGASAPLVETSIRAARATASESVVVDLSDVGFLGVRGVAVLANTYRSATYSGPAVVVVGGGRAVGRAMATCKDTARMPRAGSVAEALGPSPAGAQPFAGTTQRKRHHDSHHHLEPLFAKLAQLPAGHPRRRRIRDQLIVELLPVAQRIASRFRARAEPLGDLEQVAALGLIHAIDRFQPDRGSDFLAFAVPTITGEVQRHFRDRSTTIRMPRALRDVSGQIARGVQELSQRSGTSPTPRQVAEHTGIDLDTVLNALQASYETQCSSLDEPLTGLSGTGGISLADRIGDLDVDIEAVVNREALGPLLANLPERERAILRMRFYGNMTQTEIGQKIGISQMHVSRLLAQTLTALRQGLECS